MDRKSVAGYLGVQYRTGSGGGDDATDGTTTASTTSTDGQPGFGLAVTLAALAGVALLARRD
jgi:PGF-CTERM protein